MDDRKLSDAMHLPINSGEVVTQSELQKWHGHDQAVWVFDTLNRAMWWANTEAIRLWNSKSLNDLLSRDWSSDMSEATKVRIDDYLDRLAQGELINEQWTFYPSGEDAVTVKCHFDGIRIDDGRLAMLVKARRTTDAETSPEELRGIEALRHTSVIISLFDAEGNLLFHNPSAALSFGAADGFHSHFESAEEAEIAWQTVIDTGYYTGKHRFHTNDGVLWHGIDCTRTIDPVTAADAVLVNQRDIHKEWWSESILDWNAKVLDQIAANKPLQSLLGTIVEMAEATEPDMMCSVLLLDEEKPLLHCKAAPSLPDFFTEIIDGLEIGRHVGSSGAAAFLGEPVIVEDIGTHENWGPYREIALKANLRACWSVPIKNSDECVIGTFSAYLRNPGAPTKEHLNLLEMAANIVELAIRRHNEKEELVAARQRAENANKAKSEFLSIMSHELRTPLTSSIGSLGLLANLTPEELSNQGSELIEIALRNNNTLLRLVNELLDFEKILSGTLVIETGAQDIGKLTSLIVENLSGYAESQSVKFVVEGEKEAVFADLQEYRYEQILNNLLSNAAKFSEPGADVVISILRNNGFVLVEVKDEGPGIPEAFRDKIYEQFTQLDSSSTRTHGGTGLGLAICKALTEGMGGKIWFESEMGQGSVFTIQFPEISA